MLKQEQCLLKIILREGSLKNCWPFSIKNRVSIQAFGMITCTPEKSHYFLNMLYVQYTARFSLLCCICTFREKLLDVLNVEFLTLQQIFLHHQVDGCRRVATATDVVSLTVAKSH